MVVPQSTEQAVTGIGLDPADWQGLRAEAHGMLDDVIDHIAGLADRPLWQPAPPEVRAAFDAPLPLGPTSLAEVHAEVRTKILPYGSGNGHPGFMGWVQGGGTAVGMLGEMISGGLNSNLGGRNHVPLDVERQVGRWVREIFGFPDTADGLFFTGTSQATLVAVVAARTRTLGRQVRRDGLPKTRTLTAYASREAHACISRALDIAGIGSAQLRSIATDEDRQIDPSALRAAIEADLVDGHLPFFLVGTAGTVNTGSIDDLAALADIAAEFGLHYHVDGALGAFGILAPELAPLYAGIERADSIAFDFHKWAQVPYDAGFLLVANGQWLRDAFASDAAYLSRAGQGLAGGDWWPVDLGPDLSRGFRALKVWLTIKTYGLDQLATVMSATSSLARQLADRVDAEPSLTRLAPVTLNVVCFSYGDPEVGQPSHDSLNGRIIERLHLEGQVAPSLTVVDGKPAIRAAIVNHRTRAEDIEQLIDGVLRIGAEEAAQRGTAGPESPPTDELDSAEAALQVLQQVVHGIATDDLGKPTPCREFDVAGLTDHLLNSITMLGGAAGAQFPERNAEDSVERQLIAAARPALDAWQRRGLDGSVAWGSGEAPAAFMAAILSLEFLVHAWDYAVAIGRPIDVPDSLAEYVTGLARQIVTPEGRVRAGFDDPIDVGEHASTLERLVAFTGRVPVSSS